MISTSLLLPLLAAAAVTAEARAVDSECVVLLHGLSRTSDSMGLMAEALAEEGYTVANIDYPSRKHPIEVLAPMAVGTGLVHCQAMGATAKTHFVAHSLGGILIRQYLSENTIDNMGRVVMLGPPNQGSVAADEFRDMPGVDWLNGPAGRQLGKGEDSVPLKLGPANFELGVIAGTRSIDPITSAILPDPDDGKVSLEDTKLEGMADFVIVEHSHAMMMRLEGPIELTIQFLETGRFSAEDTPDAATAN